MEGPKGGGNLKAKRLARVGTMCSRIGELDDPESDKVEKVEARENEQDKNGEGR